MDKGHGVVEILIVLQPPTVVVTVEPVEVFNTEKNAGIGAEHCRVSASPRFTIASWCGGFRVEEIKGKGLLDRAGEIDV